MYRFTNSRPHLSHTGLAVGKPKNHYGATIYFSGGAVFVLYVYGQTTFKIQIFKCKNYG